MAAAADIAFVLDNVEPDLTPSGWTEADLTARLDGGAKPSRVVASYWKRRAAQVIQLVNTSESGSSRGMDSVYPRFKALADEWEARATADEAAVVTATQGRLSSFPIRRV